jgi:hypothetical protein
LPEREIMTGIGPVAVRCPRVRDRAGEGPERIRFSSAILPPYARLTTMIDPAVGIIRWIAQPSLAQLMLRLALAVPFWKSGSAGQLSSRKRSVDSFRNHLANNEYFSQPNFKFQRIFS